MNLTYLIENLSQNREVFRSLLAGLTPELYRWKPAPDKWCLLEMVCHLRDEEVEDFRTRVRVTLESPDTAPPPIDPVGWVQSRDYIGQDYEAELGAFLAERADSVAWLRGLVDPHWDHAYQHPALGRLSAHLFIHNWLAHDYLHFRQITRLKYQYLAAISGEDLSYAGDW
jgi:hypothetical protein